MAFFSFFLNYYLNRLVSYLLLVNLQLFQHVFIYFWFHLIHFLYFIHQILGISNCQIIWNFNPLLYLLASFFLFTLFGLFLIFLCIVNLIFFGECCLYCFVFCLFLFICLKYLILYHSKITYGHNLYFIYEPYLLQNYLLDQNFL